MPWPISPAPATKTRSIVIGRGYVGAASRSGAVAAADGPSRPEACRHPSTAGIGRVLAGHAAARRSILATARRRASSVASDSRRRRAGSWSSVAAGGRRRPNRRAASSPSSDPSRPSVRRRRPSRDGRRSASVLSCRCRVVSIVGGRERVDRSHRGTSARPGAADRCGFTLLSGRRCRSDRSAGRRSSTLGSARSNDGVAIVTLRDDGMDGRGRRERSRSPGPSATASTSANDLARTRGATGQLANGRRDARRPTRSATASRNAPRPHRRQRTSASALAPAPARSPS